MKGAWQRNRQVISCLDNRLNDNISGRKHTKEQIRYKADNGLDDDVTSVRICVWFTGEWRVLTSISREGSHFGVRIRNVISFIFLNI